MVYLFFFLIGIQVAQNMGVHKGPLLEIMVRAPKLARHHDWYASKMYPLFKNKFLLIAPPNQENTCSILRFRSFLPSSEERNQKYAIFNYLSIKKDLLRKISIRQGNIRNNLATRVTGTNLVSKDSVWNTLSKTGWYHVIAKIQNGPFSAIQVTKKVFFRVWCVYQII